MRLVRYNSNLTPWSSLDRLSPLRDLLDSAFQLAGTNGVAGEREWIPAIDVYEDADNLTVHVEAAGLKKEDFDISLHEDVLTVSGERKFEKAGKEGESFRSERFFGAFSRTIQLPVAIKAEAVSARYENGVLIITLPKAEDAKPRKIEVQVK